MRLMLERQFLIAMKFIFPVPLLVKQSKEIFMTSLSIVIHFKPQLWQILLLVICIFLKKKELSREGGITGILEVTVTEGYLMEGYGSR